MQKWSVTHYGIKFTGTGLSDNQLEVGAHAYLKKDFEVRDKPIRFRPVRAGILLPVVKDRQDGRELCHIQAKGPVLVAITSIASERPP